MKNKVILVGLPRSGTTIITKYFTSSSDRFFFSEPHWDYIRNGRLGDLDSVELKDMGLTFDEDQKFPMDPILNKLIESGYKYVGFKETYRSNLYKTISKNPNYPNQDLLESYRDREDYTLFTIVRNPIDVFNSWVSFDQKRESHTGGNIEIFIDNYIEFIENFVTDENVFVYELFTDSPDKLFEAKTSITAPEKIESARKLMGDKSANLTDKVEKIRKQSYITQEEKNIIEQSTLMDIYYNIRDKQSNLLFH